MIDPASARIYVFRVPSLSSATSRVAMASSNNRTQILLLKLTAMMVG